MAEIVFSVGRDPAGGCLVASWDDPKGGGITTQGADLGELQAMVLDAVRCHFDPEERPAAIRLHFIDDPVLAPA